MSKSKLMPTVVLSAICITVVALLALINIFTAPVIKTNQEAKLQASLKEVMPEASSFKRVEDTSKLPETVTDVFASNNGGYVFQMEVTGYSTGLIIVCGIDAEGRITGATYTKSSETLGAENELGEKYVGKTAADYTTVDVISGATRTSEGYRKAITDALISFDILTGGVE